MNNKQELCTVEANSYNFQHEITRECSDELIAELFTKKNIQAIEDNIRKINDIPESELIDGIYVIPKTNRLDIVVYKKGKILTRYTQITSIDLFIKGDIDINGQQLFRGISDNDSFYYQINQNDFRLDYEYYNNISDKDLKIIFSADSFIAIEEIIKQFYPESIINYMISDGIYFVPTENNIYIILFKNGSPVFEKTQMWSFIPILSLKAELTGRIIEQT